MRLKYTPAGGSIRVEAGEQEGDGKLTVALPELESHRKIYSIWARKFFRAKNAYEFHIPGTGLGLSITCELVKQFGGQINFQSQEGQGTTVLLNIFFGN